MPTSPSSSAAWRAWATPSPWRPCSRGRKQTWRGAADFLYMGAGTERSQLAALADFTRYGDAVRALAENSTAMLFAGTAMELLGKTITDASGRSTRHRTGRLYFGAGTRRIVGDVYGKTDICPPGSGRLANKCAVISGVTAPLLTGLELGFGNEAEQGERGFHWKKRVCLRADRPHPGEKPRLLDAVVSAIYQHRNTPLPQERPADSWGGSGIRHYGRAAAAALPGQSEIIHRPSANTVRRFAEASLFLSASAPQKYGSPPKFGGLPWFFVRSAYSVSLRICLWVSMTRMLKSSHIHGARVSPCTCRDPGRNIGGLEFLAAHGDFAVGTEILAVDIPGVHAVGHGRMVMGAMPIFISVGS